MPRYLPRKGTETFFQMPVLSVHGTKNLPRYLPRKGTETINWAKSSAGVSTDLPRYLPRKGTETLLVIVLTHNYQRYICHDIYPARGRKQHWQQPYYQMHWQICHDIYPARGRKLIHLIICFILWFNLPRYLPRKGTETCRVVFNYMLRERFATIFTPQGDGNYPVPK